MDQDRIERAVLQAAQTSRLLGVDFVPVASHCPSLAAHEAEPVDQVLARDRPPPTPDARASAQAQLDTLRARYEHDAPHEQFNTQFTNIVFGEGDPTARLMLVGEAPGAEEDRTGRPFVGRSGKLLESMLIAMGLSREAVYIANVLKTRPPGNATPTIDEARASAPYLFGQIAIIKPEAIVTLGLPAARLLLETTETMGRMRGRWHELTIPAGLDPTIVPEGAAGRTIPVMPTYHPAYLLRSYTRENRQKVWSDLQQVIELLALPAKA